MKYDKVDHAISSGNIWRAKEILGGRLSGSEVDLELLRRYGEVLLAMGDKLEAGKMLFSSGDRRPESSEAIGIFLRRHSRSNPRKFLASLPAPISRQIHLMNFIVSEEFEKNGWTDFELKKIKMAARQTKKKISSGKFRDKINNIIAFFCLSFFTISFIVGFLLTTKYSILFFINLYKAVFY